MGTVLQAVVYAITSERWRGAVGFVRRRLG
jgi:hypothetical protein